MTKEALPERMLVVWCPDWPLVAAGRVAEAAAVVEGGRVVVASPSARKAGVRSSQRRREAESRCRGIVLVSRDRGGEGRAFEPVVEALGEFGAPVVVRRPGWAALSTRGPARYFGGEASFCRRVEEALSALGLAAGGWWRVGIADGPFAATAAARLRRLVPRGEGRRFLAPFGVEALGRPELADVLRRLGIVTLGGFAALEEADVLARFGADGARAHRLARGLGVGNLPAPRRRRPGALECVLDPPAQAIEAVAFPLKRFVEQLCERLGAEGLACSLLEVEVTTTSGERLVRRLANDGPLVATALAERLRWQLEAWFAGAGAGVEGAEPGGIEQLRLVPLEVVVDGGRQLELWGRPRADDERVERTLARLQGMLGAGEVLVPFLRGGRGPKERAATVPFGDPVPAPAGDEPWPGRLPSPNPVAVPAEAPQAELADALGHRVGVDGRGSPSAVPATLAVGGAAPSTVVAWAGPWPVDEQWWDRRARHRRARFQVLTAEGAAYLLALEGGCFFVEGVYD